MTQQQLSPCFTRIAVANADGKRWAFACDYSCSLGVAWPDDKVTASGWNDTPFTPDPSPIVAAALAATLVRVSATDLRSFVGGPCERCGDARRTACKPCDECEGDGWIACTCVRHVEGGSLPAKGFPGTRQHYDRRLIGAAIRSMPTVETYLVGETEHPRKDYGWTEMVIRAGERVAVVMQIDIRKDDRAPFPKFKARKVAA